MSYAAGRRTNEIGIRMALGGTLSGSLACPRETLLVVSGIARHTDLPVGTRMSQYALWPAGHGPRQFVASVTLLFGWRSLPAPSGTASLKGRSDGGFALRMTLL